jgi:prolyl oligopeptidase
MTDQADQATTSAPPADRDEVSEVLHGVTVADPYRYLEDPDSERTIQFVTAQNAVSAPYLAGLPAGGHFLASVTELLTRPRAGTPWEYGGRYFRLDNPGDADQDRLLTGADLEELLERPRVLLDPNELADDGTVALMSISVSPDGRLVAVGLSEAGSDWRTVIVLDAADGSELSDRLRWTKFVAPTWLPDSSGFLYWRYPEPSGQQLVDSMPPGELLLHRLGTDQQTDSLVWSRSDSGRAANWMVQPEFSGDGRWLMLTAAPGTDSRTVVEVRSVDVDAAELFGPPRPVVAELADVHHPVAVIDDVLYLHTERDAERGRLVTVDLGQPDGEFTDLVGEDPADLLVSVSAADGAFVLVRSRDTAHRVQIVGPDAALLTDVELSDPASVTEVHCREASREIFIGSTSFTRRLTIQRIELADGSVAVQQIPAGSADSSGDVRAVLAQRRRGTSADGTQVPMTVVRLADPVGGTAGPAPTLLYGYGGFDIPMSPSFSALFAAWVQAGGVFVVANLRGGGEFGQLWHQAGMGAHKQRVFDDLFGCAEALIADGTTTAGQLAVHGRSNGGLLVGAAIVQRPELWAAALPTVGVLDMLRFHRFTVGQAWTSEYGDPDNADDFAVLHRYSPLHNLAPDVDYPPTLICTGDHDDRVVPAHSLKFGAQLQFCQRGTAQALLRIDTRAGHGMGKPVGAQAAEYADQLAFAAAHTGLVPRTRRQ